MIKLLENPVIFTILGYHKFSLFNVKITFQKITRLASNRKNSQTSLLIQIRQTNTFMIIFAKENAFS